MHELTQGLLLVDKHAGCTSHDVVVQARRLLKTRKIGHCGTLDPDATGLLLLTVGRATRLTRFLIKAPKVYEGTIRFGISTDTYDTSGTIVSERPTDDLCDRTIGRAMDAFLGTYEQTPPPYCAKKIGGVKYYELARRGEATPDAKKPVSIYTYQPLAGYQPGVDLPFRLSCASGTYARSLAHELGERLGTGAVLASLRRTQISTLYNVEQAATIATLRQRMEEGEVLGSAWLPFDEIPLPFSEVIADAQQERRIGNGQTVLVHAIEGQEGDWVKLIDSRHRFLAVGAVVERIGAGGVGVVQPKVVFR